MAQTSYPFDSQAITETQYSQFFREFVDTGIAASADSTSLKVGAAGTNMTVTVQPGFAVVRGFAYNSSAVESLTIATANTSARVDRVVLRLDPAANSIILAVKTGTAGSSTPPTLTQTDTGVYELPLAQVAVGGSVTSIASGNVTDERIFGGSSAGSWSQLTRPTSARQGKLGYNRTTGAFETWDGASWAPLVPSTPLGAIIAYGGSTAPSGWHLCDGSAHGSSALQAVIGSPNAPDLRGRFIVGTSGTYAQGSSGGAATVTLTAAQSGLPAHAHTASSGSMTQNTTHGHSAWTGGMDGNVSHNHGGATVPGQGAHAHGGAVMDLSDAYARDPYKGGLLNGLSGAAPTGAHTHDLIITNTSIDHGHPVGIAATNIDHGHPITVNAVAAASAASAHENMPPYYALTYIIRKS